MLNLYESAVVLRGNDEDYYALAVFEANYGNSCEDNDEGKRYIYSARNRLNKIEAMNWDSRHYSLKAVTGLFLFDNLTDTTGYDENNAKEIIDEAAEIVNDLLEKRTVLDRSDYYFFGRIIVEKADLEINVNEKNRSFLKGIELLEKSVDKTDLRDFLVGKLDILAEAKSLYCDSCLDLDERLRLRESAISDLRRSYVLCPDEETLEMIEELKSGE